MEFEDDGVFNAFLLLLSSSILGFLLLSFLPFSVAATGGMIAAATTFSSSSITDTSNILPSPSSLEDPEQAIESPLDCPLLLMVGVTAEASPEASVCGVIKCLHRRKIRLHLPARIRIGTTEIIVILARCQR